MERTGKLSAVELAKAKGPTVLRRALPSHLRHQREILGVPLSARQQAHLTPAAIHNRS